jgi:[protein-PII] uridylyltransferase
MDSSLAMTEPLEPTARWISQRMNAARDQAAAGLRAGQPGVVLAEQLSHDVEAIIAELLAFHLARARKGSSSEIAVLATGGFGRHELAPYSDLDLLFLCAKSPDAAVEDLARAILVPLWDAKVDAGHAVRSVSDALALPATDLAAATALLDARFLTGSRGLADRFLSSYQTRVAKASPDGFVARLRAEQYGRHSRFGDTIFMLEPDLKNGPGGLRDLCVGRWAAQVGFKTADPQKLHEMGEMSARQAAAMEAARDWLLRVRAAVHLTAGRRQEQLRFDLQESIAPLFHPAATSAPGEVRPAVAPAVEALMHDFQKHARVVSQQTTRLLLRVSTDRSHRPTVQSMRIHKSGEADPSFEIPDGVIEVKKHIIFENKPSEMIRLFSLSIESNLAVGRRTADLVAENAASRAVALREDPEAAARFLQVLADTRDAGTPSRLEQMHDLGLISALIPEWEPVVGRVQHDLYHVYTVDQHSLYAVATLKAIARGEMAAEYPQVSAEFPAVTRRLALFVAVLLHDVGKPLGSPHDEKGAVLSERIAARLGLIPADVRLVEFLVREHLFMSHTSQRRDLEDVSLIAHFAKGCENEEKLRQLFLLTFCDLASTGPKTMTHWKSELMAELFERTLKFMRRGADLLQAEQAELVQERQRQAAQLLAGEVDGPALADLFAGLPDRYFTENEADRIAAHMRLALGRRGPCAIEVNHSPRGTFSELVLVAQDVPGLLARVAGVFFANRIDILDAAIYSREAVTGRDQGEALDVFRIRKEPDGAVTDKHRIASIQADLEAVLAGRATVDALLARRPRTLSIIDRAKPEVPPTEVRVDNEISPVFTVLDVFTEDKPGVLYTITRTLAEHGLDIHRSRVGVAGDRVADIFYLRDIATGGKLTDPARLNALADGLKKALPASAGRKG